MILIKRLRRYYPPAAPMAYLMLIKGRAARSGFIIEERDKKE